MVGPRDWEGYPASRRRNNGRKPTLRDATLTTVAEAFSLGSKSQRLATAR